MFCNLVFSHEVCRPIVVAASSKRLSSACHLPGSCAKSVRDQQVFFVPFQFSTNLEMGQYIEIIVIYRDTNIIVIVSYRRQSRH